MIFSPHAGQLLPRRPNELCWPLQVTATVQAAGSSATAVVANATAAMQLEAEGGGVAAALAAAGVNAAAVLIVQPTSAVQGPPAVLPPLHPAPPPPPPRAPHSPGWVKLTDYERYERRRGKWIQKHKTMLNAYTHTRRRLIRLQRLAVAMWGREGGERRAAELSSY